MKSRSMMRMVIAFCLVMVIGPIVHAQAKKNLKDEVQQSERAAQVFREIMDAPDKGIPEELLASAECVAVFPSVLKAGLIPGGGSRRGLASCRVSTGWSAPAYFTLGGGNSGFETAAQSTDFVMLVMNKEGLNILLSDGFTLGEDASVAAGPVGRHSGEMTDQKLTAQILSYSRSTGLFAGLDLKGAVIKPDRDDMRAVYGEGVTAKEVLKENKVMAPVSVRAFPNALTTQLPILSTTQLLILSSTQLQIQMPTQLPILSASPWPGQLPTQLPSRSPNQWPY